jgi:hypothetical protein
VNANTNVIVMKRAQDPTTWSEVEEVLRRHLHEPDVLAARGLYSAVAAHQLAGPPCWPMLVAPPGSGKTELVGALNGLPKLHLIDEFTLQTLISGQLPDPKRVAIRPASLLHRIGASGIIVAPDFSTVLAMKADDRAKILAQLRRVYDGQFRKEFGTADAAPPEWRGRITFVAAVTPAIDQHYAAVGALGERFVLLRWPRADGVAAALAAMNQDPAAVRSDLQKAVHALLSNRRPLEPDVPDAAQRQVAALAEFVVRARSSVPRSGYSREIIAAPDPESPTRLSQQLIQLAKGSALLDDQGMVSGRDLQVARRAGLDSIPPLRRKILDALVARVDLKEISMPGSTRMYAMEDLEVLGLLEGNKWTPMGQELIAAAELKP